MSKYKKLSREEKLAYKAEKMRAYRQKDPVKFRARDKEYARKKRERNPEGQKLVYKRFTEKLRSDADRLALYRANARKYRLSTLYKLTPEEWNVMFKSQGYRCACCGTDSPDSKKGFVTDHCHVSKKVRGILCDSCNVAIGRLGDTYEALAVRAIQTMRYLSPFRVTFADGISSGLLF